ncbi:hypothetical protein J3R30DRAFT_3425187 [Lentinula aciculospora]|uniref:F-box domain-containing protein n=1 Tax=Lentinula aciculospora TaxID=153920 RepID=A0A9W9AX39_9AGAR|nr:hypothetical protein J3R30DRAFT_3425187 [Lentinula aciculospora]
MVKTRKSSNTTPKVGTVVDHEAFVLSSDDSELDNFKTKYIASYHSPKLEESSGNFAQNKLKIRRGNKGILENMLKLPLDIVLEIYSYLKPLDLLRLSRTSKDFRAFLMTRSNAIVWCTARSNVPSLPSLPSDLSEPQYANLAFDSYCHVCMSSHSLH